MQRAVVAAGPHSQCGSCSCHQGCHLVDHVWSEPCVVSQDVARDKLGPLFSHLVLAYLAIVLLLHGGALVTYTRFSESTPQKSPLEVSRVGSLESAPPVIKSKESVSETIHLSPEELSKSSITSEEPEKVADVEPSAESVSAGTSQEEKSEKQVEQAEGEEKLSGDEQYVVRAQPKVMGQDKEVESEVQLDRTVSGEADSGQLDAQGATLNAAEGSVASEKVLSPPPVDNVSGNVTFDEDGTRVIDPVTENAVTEDIPSFSEWAQKQLAEAEKKKGGHNMTGGGNGQSRTTGTPKLRSKNYASPDCGAKIIAANVEAQNPSAVISHSRDEYMLNVCTNKVWFVIELCEGIQAKKIEIANFELFSSSPRDFVVSISDRYPTRDWRSVGVFTADDERNVQNFSLSQHLFGKFVKVELSSHYGSEHYCPVSLFRVYGTSEYEVLDREDEHAENVVESDIDDDDETLVGENASSPSPAEDFGGGIQQPQPQNLFGSARDAVMSIVKKAAQALVKGEDKQQGSITLDPLHADHPSCNRSSCVTPLHEVVCQNCTVPFMDRLFDYFSCSYQDLRKTKRETWDFMRDSGVCHSFGLALPAYLVGADRTPYDSRVPYLISLLSQEYLAALCNVVAEEDRKLRLNLTLSGKLKTKSTPKAEEKEAQSTPPPETEQKVQETCTLEPTKTEEDVPTPTQPTFSEPTVETATINMATSTSTAASDDKGPPDQVAIRPTRTIRDEGDVLPALPVETVHQPLVPTKAKGTSTQVDPPSTPRETATLTVVPGGDGTTADSHMKTSENGTPPAGLNRGSDGTPVPSAPSSGEPVSPPQDGQQGGKTAGKAGASDKHKAHKVLKEDDLPVPPVPPQQLQTDASLDSLLSEVEATMEGSVGGDSSSAVPVGTIPTVQQGQKESVFVRLSNRIKALEVNLSLSSQYLEELSRRYKRQMEELQKALNKTAASANETSSRAAEWQKSHGEMLLVMQVQVANLTRDVQRLTQERDSIHGKVLGQHLVLMLAELVAMGFAVRYCLRRHERRIMANQPLPPPPNPFSLHPHLRQQAKNRTGGGSGSSRTHPSKNKKYRKQPVTVVAIPRVAQVERRRSVEGVSGHLVGAAPKIRRPSEEALNISGTYENLLIPEVVQPAVKRRRKRRREMHKSASSNNLNGALMEEEGDQLQGDGISIVGSFKGLGAPPGLEDDWWGQVEDSSRTWHGFPPERIQAVVAEAKARQQVAAVSQTPHSVNEFPPPVTQPVVPTALTNGVRKDGATESSLVIRGKAKAESGLRRILNKIF